MYTWSDYIITVKINYVYLVAIMDAESECTNQFTNELGLKCTNHSTSSNVPIMPPMNWGSNVLMNRGSNVLITPPVI